MKKGVTSNTFDSGLIMDLNPLVTPNNVMTNALNATLVTFNGNENALQNDMGNGRVETAYLPEGYIPLGTAELGGIIYIVSYNPLKDKCQIGSFPSPERNISSSETGDNNKVLACSAFYESAESDFIITPTQRLILFDTNLNPGDKFQIYCSDIVSNYGILSAFGSTVQNVNDLPKYLKLLVVSITDDGTITDLSDSLNWYDVTDSNNKDLGKYYILTSGITTDNGTTSLDEYRNIVSSNYNTYSSKTSGKLAILGQLECIDTFSVSWDVMQNSNNEYELYLFLNWTYENEYDNNGINLYSVRVVDNSGQSEDTDIIIEDYPKQNNTSDNDPLNNQDNIFYNPTYVSSIEDWESGLYTSGKTVTEEQREVKGYILVGDNVEDNIKNAQGDYYEGSVMITNYENKEYAIKNAKEYAVLGTTTTGSVTTKIYAVIVSSDPSKDEFPATITIYYITTTVYETSTTKRANDGSDNQFVINTGVLLSNAAESGTCNYTIYPGMKFGYLKYLGQDITINVDALGSGAIDLKKYRYYIDDTITFNYALEAYTERHKSIKSVEFLFYKYDNSCRAIIEAINANENIIDDSNVQFTLAEDSDITMECNLDTTILKHSNYFEKDSWVWDYLFFGNSDADYQKIHYHYLSAYDATTEELIGTIYPSLQYKITDQTSFSGSFNFTLDGYEENTLYFVVININYNDEYFKTYFRFLYTSGLFNDYYYEVSDFSTLNLGDILESKNIFTSDYSYDIQNTSSQSLRERIGPYSYEVDYIPSEIISDSSRIDTYYQTNVLNVSTSGNLSYKSSDDTFVATLTIDKNAEVTLDHTEDYTLVSTALFNSSSSSTSQTLPDIEIELSSMTSTLDTSTNSLSISLKESIHTPLMIGYVTYGYLNINYELDQLDMYHLWFCGDMSSNVNISLVEEFGSDDKLLTKTYAEYRYGPILNSTTNADLYNKLIDLLDSYDIVALKFYPAKNYVFVGRGLAANSQSTPHFSEQAMYTANSPGLNGVPVFYAMRDDANNIRIFTFGMYGNCTSTDDSKPRKWYGVYLALASTSTTGNIGYNYNSNLINKPIAIGAYALTTNADSSTSDSLIPDSYSSSDSWPSISDGNSTYAEDIIFAPFSFYYKLSENSTAQFGYTWGYVQYYEAFVLKTNINVIISSLIRTIGFNGDSTILAPTSGYVPNNLSYTSEQNNATFTIPITLDIISDSYVNSIATSSVQLVYNEFLDKYVYIENPNTSSLYNALGNEMQYLKQDDGLSLFNRYTYANNNSVYSFRNLLYNDNEYDDYNDNSFYDIIYNHNYLQNSKVQVSVGTDGRLRYVTAGYEYAVGFRSQNTSNAYTISTTPRLINNLQNIIEYSTNNAISIQAQYLGTAGGNLSWEIYSDLTQTITDYTSQINDYYVYSSNYQENDNTTPNNPINSSIRLYGGWDSSNQVFVRLFAPESDSITVIWHIGDTTVKNNYGSELSVSKTKYMTMYVEAYSTEVITSSYTVKAYFYPVNSSHQYDLNQAATWTVTFGASS